MPERIKWNRRNLNRLLCQTVEQFSSRGRLAPVESKRELIQIVLEIFMSYGALMRAQQPAFGQRNDPMDPRQQMFGIGRLMLLDLALVNIAFHFAVSLQTVGYNRAARFDGLGNKTMQRGAVGIGDVLQADATDALSVGLGRDDDHCFAHRLAPPNSGLLRSPIA